MFDTNILKSRTIWTLVVLFVINGVGGVRESIPANWLLIIDGVLTILAAYFRINVKQPLGGFRKKVEA